MSSMQDVKRTVDKIKTLFSRRRSRQEYAYCAIFVLSHGGICKGQSGKACQSCGGTDSNGKEILLCGSKDHFSMKNDILQKLTLKECPDLEHLPVVGVVRACRGNHFNSKEYVVLANEVNTSHLPAWIILNSTREGFYDVSSKTDGSKFIEVFCKRVKEGDDMETLSRHFNALEITRTVPDPESREGRTFTLEVSVETYGMKKKFKFY